MYYLHLVPPCLDAATPTARLQSSMPPRRYTYMRAPRPPYLDIATPAARLRTSIPPYLYASTSACLQRASRPPYIHVSTSLHLEGLGTRRATSYILVFWIDLNCTRPSSTFNTCTGTLTFNASSPGRFIGAENPATCKTELPQVGHFHCLSDFRSTGSWPLSSFLMQTLQNWWSHGRILFGSFRTALFRYFECINLHAVAKSRLTLRTHSWLRRVEFRLCSCTLLLVHRTHRDDITKVTSLDPILDLLFNHEEWHVRFHVFLCANWRWLWHDVCDLFAANWV